MIASVFATCQWTVVPTFERMYWVGISNAEVYAVCRLQSVPEEKWAAVLVGIRMMVGAARPLLNEKKN